MGQFIRMINHGIVYILIRQVEEICYSYDHFLKFPPYSFNNREFQRVFGCFLEEFSHCFASIEPLYKGERIVLRGNERCTGNLGSEIPHLTFTWIEQSFGFLEEQCKALHRVH